MTEIAIVEDDLNEQKRLLKLLKRYSDENDIAFSFSLYNNAFDFLEDKKAFDIAFLDIMMPNMTGMEAAEKLRQRGNRTVIIFVTTMVQFALKSYEVDALDYIVKPASYERLTMKLGRAIQVIEAGRESSIVVNGIDGTVRLNTNDIIFVEVSGHRLTYHTKGGNYTEYGSLTDLEKVLSANGFMRCNACYLVNPRHIKQVNHKDLLVIMSGGEALKISQAKRKSFINELTNYLGQGKR